MPPDLATRLAQLDADQIRALLGIKPPPSIAEYIAEMELPFRPAKHHRVLIEALEKVASGTVNRLMVMLPPGAGKSTYTSVVFPAWYLGVHPSDSIIAASHTEELTSRFGRRARNLFAEAARNGIFRAGVAKDSGAAGRWDTDRGGEYYAVGFNGAVTGRRCDILIVDDPVRGREDADSQRVRDKTWDVYIHDLLTRMKPHARQCVISTRWHEDDLCGRILAQEGPRWHVIRLPMEAQADDVLGRAPGERLWPEWFTPEMVSDAKRDARAWSALYQQEPASEDGDYFKREWFRDYDVTPTTLAVYGSTDAAVTERGGDFTEHAIWGLDPNRNLHVLDWWSGQRTADEWIEIQCDLIARWKPLRWFGEAGPLRRSLEPFLARRMSERGTFVRMEWLASIHDKGTRCRAFQALAANGKVFFPKHAEWKSDVIGQLLRFPAGMHDDKVDCCSLVGRGLESIRAPETNLGELPTHANLGYQHLKPRWSRFRAHPTPAQDAGLAQFPEWTQAELHAKFIAEQAAALRPQRRR